MSKGGAQPGAGRPKGSLSKPRIYDYMTQEDIEAVVAKALEMAKAGNESMMKLIIEQNFGKPPQAITGADGGPLEIQNITGMRIIADNGDNIQNQEPQAAGS